MDIHVVTVSDQERTVSILVIHIVVSWLVQERVGMEMLSVPFNAVYTHRGMVHIKHLEFTVFITGGKNQVATMQPLQSVVHHILRLCIDLGIVPPSVLHHHRLDLFLRHHHRLTTVVHCGCHLLVGVVDIYVGVGTHRHLYPHQRFQNHEAGSEHRLIVVVLIHHRQLIVPAHLDAASVVGNT